ncbi:hypothetical protein DSO57_1017054 [Entomophthora muscae]|uniref:Uncharacterized protein n=1 Tax=Entomophthora muscae TaxID=34485 RepID=A0ACC2T5K1_9FUNG|nr:hypothetical protein DSO57_1017054 [Entomophthora muscae]
MHCLESILPVNRRILKPEIFRAKTQLAAVMNGAIKSLESKLWESKKPGLIEFHMNKLRKLIAQYANMIAEEFSSYVPKSQQKPVLVDAELPHRIVCDYCHCDIWNSWFRCESCVSSHDLCIECYAERRRCFGFKSMVWHSHRSIKRYFKDLKKLSKLFNASETFSFITGLKRVKDYSEIWELQAINPKQFSSMTTALILKDKYTKVSNKNRNFS